MKVDRFLFLILIFLSILIFPKSKPDNSKILAEVGKYRITLDDFTNRYEDYLVYAGVQDNMQLRFSILNNMINEIVLHNFDNNSKILNNIEYQKEIKWARNETVLAYLKDQEIYSKISATDEEVKEAFRRSNIKLAVRHLYAPTEEAANNLYELLKMGVSFNKLAKQVFTDSILQNNGGYLGYISWGQTDPNFENAAYSLKVGEISKPVKTAQGYSIIKVENKIEDPLMTENEFLNKKNKLERAVKIAKKIPYENAYLKKVFGNEQIKFNDSAVKNILNDIEQKDFSLESTKSSKKNIPEAVLFNGEKFSLNKIEAKLQEVPQYNLKELTSEKKIKEAVLGLLMQDKLLSIAQDKGYDTVSYVKDTFNKLANNIFLNYKRNEVISKIDVPDSELIKYYNDNISYFKNEDEMNLQEIILDDSLSVKNIEAKIESGDDFGELAQKYSLRKWTAKNKGELGLSPVSKFGELKDTLWNTPLGKVIGPIKIENYFGFFKVIKKQDGLPISFDMVKPQILYAVRNEKGFPYMKKHIDTLSKKVSIKVNEDILKSYKINLAGVN